jgi:hypothetical protein
MRPINRGNSPNIYTNYEEAKPDLVDRLGSYCSYCERRIPTNLAVEHILPKDDSLGFTHLENEWTNFLLGCVNCNSAKRIKIISFDQYLLPDRDNTFPYFDYQENGMVEVVAPDDEIARMAQNTLDMVVLNRFEHPNWDSTIMFSAIERVGQRVQAWVQAKDALQDYLDGFTIPRRIAAEAAATGFFSIWMTAFEGHIEVRKAIIEIFSGTAADCFDDNTDPIYPRPNNGLENSGKA